MAYKSSYSYVNVDSVAKTIRAIARDASDMSATGYVALGAKQDLYRLKWMIDDALKQCPDFGSTESEWLREQEKEKVWNILNEKTNK